MHDDVVNLSCFGNFLKGTCELMCPEKERITRERERLLHPLEVDTNSENLSRKQNVPSREFKKGKGNAEFRRFSKADPLKTVKSYSRSAAGQEMPSPSDLRPTPVLLTTVDYLLREVASTDLNYDRWTDRYDFITDRLRAVRKDMIIQGLPPEDCIKILEPMVRFHAFAGYWLCEKPINKFDPKINMTLLLECMKRLLSMYDYRKENASLSDYRSSEAKAPPSITQGRTEDTLSCSNNEHILEAMYVILNLGENHSLQRSLLRASNRSQACQSCWELKALHLSLAWLRGDYVLTCRLLRNLPPLLGLVAAIHLPNIRRHALMVMNTAYSSKVLRFPVAFLRSILLWESSAAVVEDCRYYGISIDTSVAAEPSVCFLKACFMEDKKVASPRREPWLDHAISKTSVTDLFLRKTGQ